MSLEKIRKEALRCLLMSLLMTSGILGYNQTSCAIGGSGLIAYPANPDSNNPLTESWFIYDLDRGESKKDALILENNSEEEIFVRLYTVDSTTNNVGEFSLESETDSRDEIGQWIKLSTESLALKPGEGKRIDFTITIPQNARSGEISGGIIIQKELTEEQKNATSGFVISTRLGIRIYETVPGEVIQKVIFENASLEYNEEEKNYTLSVLIKNESNVSVEPRVKAQVKDAFFDIQNQTVEQKITIPRDSEASVSLIIDKPKIGKFEITPQVSYQKQNGEEETLSNDRKLYFWTLPWDEIIIVTLLLLANLLFLAILKIISYKEKKYYKSYKIKKGDNLEKIADKLGTDWKKIAKINKIKPPYHLSEGQIITVFDKKDMLEQLYMENEKIGNEIHSSSDGTFDKDLSEIYDKKGFFSKIGEKLGIRKDICFLFIIAIILVTIGYFLYVNISFRKNNAQFMYEDAKVFEDNIDKEGTVTEEKENAKEADMSAAENSEENSPTIQEEPIQTELGQADREGVLLLVLNGSGTKGASSSASTILQEGGYPNITTGNANSFTYDTTLVQCESEVKNEICEEIKSLLSTSYTTIEIENGPGMEKNTVKIILGK
ncbi:MAG: DUF916 domain-containing protein [Candidatus Pacebacteria bacterium]|nr:DUF916 domain-containing protein [Candidatus Paceibacterota bacterium]